MNKNINENNIINIVKRNSLFSIITDKTMNTKSTDESPVELPAELPAELPKKEIISCCFPFFIRKKKYMNKIVHLIIIN